ncbi:hypothetical protein [Streptomyces sp. NPDC047130]|uniref:hypothetical protein n=1 Tax=Streptomyces sp. NPDC047130 TaxID=3155261 RepID=UPI00340EAA01
MSPYRADRAPRPHGRLGRIAAATAGAALTIGALTSPALGAGQGGEAAGLSTRTTADAAPAVSLGSGSVAAGAQVSFTATGLPAGATLNVKLDKVTLLTPEPFTVGADGSATGRVTVPEGTTAGAHTLYFLVPGQPGIPVALTVRVPAAELLASSVQAGGAVPFRVSGFPANSALNVKLDDAALLTSKPFTTDANGSFSGSVTVPADTAAGDHSLRFLAAGTSVKSSTFTVTAKPAPAGPKAVVTAGSSVAAGGKVSFSLSGFVKGQNITVKLDDGAILKQWENAVRADGTFSGTVTVPKDTAKGAHWLRILAPDPSTSLRADFTVTSGGGSGSGGSTGGGSTGGDSGSGGSTGGGSGSGGSTGGGSTGGSTGGSATGGTSSGASASITAGSSVRAGGKVSFRVTGFPAGERLTVKLDDSEIIGQWTIGSDGSFSGSVTVPSGTTKGAHWLRFLAPNPSTSLRADFTVTDGADPASAATGGSGAGGTGATGDVPAATGSPASASNSAGAKAEITASEVQPGGTIHFTVTKFPKNETVTVKLDDDGILGQWKTDAEGSYEGDIEIPADTPAGEHWFRFLAPNPPTSLKVDFTVVAAGRSAPAATDSTAAPQAETLDGAPAATTTAASPVSYATIGWSTAGGVVGGAAGAAAAGYLVLRRARPKADPAGTGTPAAG